MCSSHRISRNLPKKNISSICPYKDLHMNVYSTFFCCCWVGLGLFLFSFLLFRAALATHGSSQARCRIRAAAVGLHHSHSNAQTLNPVRRARDRTASSWLLAMVITTEPQQELLCKIILEKNKTGRISTARSQNLMKTVHCRHED